MKFAKDFRGIAREALKGKWWLALIVGLVASLLGGISSGGPEVRFTFGDTSNSGISIAGKEISIDPHIISFLAGAAVFLLLIVLSLAVLYIVLGSFVGVGYARFNLDLIDRNETGFASLFAYFSYWKTTTVARLLRGLYIFLWSLLLIIPGIVASFRYSMTDFILAENPDLSASQAIEKSKAMMSGNKWRLFCLHFSFIGWDILASLTFGIGYLWLTPYKQAAFAAFYRDVSKIEGGSKDYPEFVETIL